MIFLLLYLLLTYRLRTSSVLVVFARGLGAELCKNIVLAGVKSITLLDNAPLKSSDLGSRFLGNTDGVNVSNIYFTQHSLIQRPLLHLLH